MAITMVLLALASGVVQKVAGDHPAIKIIALIEKLQAQVKEEGDTDTHLYGKFTYWCDETSKKKAKAIKEFDEAISVAKTSIEALTTDIETLQSEVDKLAAEISAEEAARAKAQAARDKALAAYQANKADLEGTIQACQDAITALDQAMPSALVQAKTLIENFNGIVPRRSDRALAFMQRADPVESDMADKFDSRQGGDATYSFKGGDATEMLKKMRTQYEDDLVALNKAEAEEASLHALADSAHADAINAATESKETKETVIGEKGQEKSTQQSILTESQDSLIADKTVLDDTKTTCKTRAEEYDYNMKTRAKEIEAMDKAKEIIEKVTGVRSPESKGIETVGFIQLSKKFNDPLPKILAVLRKAGSSKKTVALAKLADKIAKLQQTPGSGTFDQIKNMIEKMIFHLMSEQKDEDDHKNWCDKEIEMTTKMATDKTDKKDSLNADIDVLNAEITALTTGIAENQAWISDMDGQIAAQTSTRADNKKENEATMTDAVDAQTAISQAIAVLEDFYKDSGEIEKEAWESFVQLRTVRRSGNTPGETEADEPVLWESKPYTGTEGGSAVIGMLENVATDFAAMESASKAEETRDQDEYDEWLTAATGDKAAKVKDTEMKSSRKERMEEKLAGKSTDLDHTVKELDSTNKYMKDLQHACVDGDSTYSERKAARTQEITALREAETILDNAFAA